MITKRGFILRGSYFCVKYRNYSGMRKIGQRNINTGTTILLVITNHCKLIKI